MKSFNRRDYAIRGCEESIKILKDESKGIGDKDINNLKLILFSIMPGSRWFRRGCIRSLRKAIKLLEKEKAIEKKGEDTMPSVEHMRSAISDAYPGEGWKFRCEHMRDNQVIAIYGSLKRRGAFDGGSSVGVTNKSDIETRSDNCTETATDAPRFIPYTGVQLSIFDI